MTREAALRQAPDGRNGIDERTAFPRAVWATVTKWVGRSESAPIWLGPRSGSRGKMRKCGKLTC
jgi:hypothetical protein